MVDQYLLLNVGSLLFIIYQGVEQLSMELTTHVSLVVGLRICEYLPLLIHMFSWCIANYLR
jgi:hypothetical protein